MSRTSCLSSFQDLQVMKSIKDSVEKLEVTYPTRLRLGGHTYSLDCAATALCAHALRSQLVHIKIKTLGQKRNSHGNSMFLLTEYIIK